MGHVRCKRSMQYYYRRGDQGRKSPTCSPGSGVKCQQALMRVSAQWTEKVSAKESFLMPQAHGEKGQAVAMETLSSD